MRLINDQSRWYIMLFSRQWVVGNWPGLRATPSFPKHWDLIFIMFVLELEEVSSSRCITSGVFGSQSYFAKPKFGWHNLVRMCLVFAILWLVIFYSRCDTFIIELLLLPPKFDFIFLSHTFMASHTLAWWNVARNQTPPSYFRLSAGRNASCGNPFWNNPLALDKSWFSLF
jgi:hypothetical protein